jgi:N-acetylmuramoyl-L-alanine amidase
VVALLLAGAGVIVWRGLHGGPLRIFSDDNGLPTVVVDAGHGGHDGGAARNGVLEKNLTLDTALRVEKKLRALGFPVVLTRRDDRFMELGERSDIANRFPHALFVSIHFNDNVAATGEGVETFYAGDKAPVAEEGWSVAGLFRATPEPSPADNGMAFAQTVQTAVVGALGVTDRGVKSARYAVVRHTRCPAVLVEGGFINNPAQAKQIAQPAYREKLAAAIVNAVVTYQRQRALDAKKPVLAQAGR